MVWVIVSRMEMDIGINVIWGERVEPRGQDCVQVKKVNDRGSMGTVEILMICCLFMWVWVTVSADTVDYWCAS